MTSTNGQGATATAPDPDPTATAPPARRPGPLQARIARIAGEVGRLTEDGQVTGKRGFKYATVDAMAQALTPLMAAEGVAMYPVKTRILRSEEILRDKVADDGRPYQEIRWLTEILVTWEISDGESSIRVPIIGKSVDADRSEKDANQAHTFSRINAYKAVFHLAAGEDPEHKGGGRGSAGAGTQPSGELPSIEGATVNGYAASGPDGQIGLSYSIEPRSLQNEVNALVRALGGTWNREAKLYAIASQHARSAVRLARHLGLEIPDDVAARFPLDPPTPPEPNQAAARPQEPQDGQGGAGAGPSTPENDKPSEAPAGPAPSPADEAAADEAAAVAFGAEPTAPAPVEAAAAPPTFRVPDPVDPKILGELKEPAEGSKDAGRAIARGLGLRMRLDNDELAVVRVAEQLGLPGMWALYDDRVYRAMQDGIEIEADRLERQGQAA